MDLLAPVPPMNLYQPDWPIRTYHGQHPPARMAAGTTGHAGQVVDSMLSSGTVISGGTVRHSVLFPQVQVDENAVVEDSILFDGVHVGGDSHLKRCIVDKDVLIPPGERIGFDAVADAARFTVSESGITVVPKGYSFLTNAPHSLQV
jgi:glucose-1-phosphate adenylyltransferase